MKRILITGAQSYVGISFEKWLKQWPDEYFVDTVDVRDDTWKAKSFKGYDVVFHVAGIVHNPKSSESMSYKINRDLSYKIAKKAKESAVKQFVFMSTMSVYGKKDLMGKANEINSDTPCAPITPYGKSKLEAERLIGPLQSESFNVSILRPPMIYGANCTGNYRMLRSLTLRFGICPDINNSRSMLYIDNLCMFLKWILNRQESGVFCPQDKEFFNTVQVMQWIAEANNKKIVTSKLLAVVVLCAASFVIKLKKAFGNLTYAEELLNYKEACESFVSLRDAISMTEKSWKTD